MSIPGNTSSGRFAAVRKLRSLFGRGEDANPQTPQPQQGAEYAYADESAQALHYVDHYGEGSLGAYNLGKSYRGRQVVQNISLAVRRGEAVGLLGPNGAGKTTVFYMITGLVKPDKGEIELDGHDVTSLPMYRRARLGIGYLPQEASIFRGLNVEDNIRAVLEVAMPSLKRSSTNLTSNACASRPRLPYRAANVGAAKLPARWPANPRSCCSTSPSRASIRSPSGISSNLFVT